MLVLTRRTGEKLVIGNEVILEVVSISGDGVRLGISAPREMLVHRFEVFEEIQKANRAAAAFAAGEETLQNLATRLRKRKKD
jgi:carbon storage regulator